MLYPKTFLIFARKVQYNTLLDMKIQEVMKLQRKALGITQQDLADMSEIAISTIKKIESGKGNPSLSTVEKIMDILGMEVKYEIRQTVQTRRSNFQQNIKEIGRASCRERV